MSLRLVVIDDEILVRKGIISSVEWERYGIEIAGEAPDGKSALELIRSTKPHIVLTDIRMPHMDGLEMIRCIRSELPETKIFILSVLDDFQTVREALRLGVVDYIPKLSMTPDELLQVVLSVTDTLDAEPPAAAAKPAVKPLVAEDANHQEPQRSAFNGVPSQSEGAEAGHGLEEREAEAETQRSRTDSLGQMSQARSTSQMASAVQATSQMSRLLHPLQTAPSVQPPQTSQTDSPGQPPQMPQMALPSQTPQSTSPTPRLAPASNANQAFMPKEAITAYFAALDTDTEAAADRAFQKLFPERLTEQIPPAAVRDEIYYWVSTVNLYVKDRGGNLHTALSGVSPFEELGRLQTYPDIREWCLRLHDMLKSMLLVLRSAHRREIRKAIDYVRANYMLPIRVKEIAQWVHLSENYFSNVFAKETGKPFIQFLQEIRVDEAKRLLKEETHDWPLIGEKVGFESPKYFTKVFKKFTGVTPKQYAKTRN
ncbi:response regulator [Paenibacillus thalictri]|uniref:Response regulator n=1 Tax=Paenibacillus thalictri TaxID=2527873 RepID=A0A4Q9DJG9_9BACL|nr:response regulator [Paenibacillus thalictri]TBL71086.1 response regulator [Paenibacillus thalictri]